MRPWIRVLVFVLAVLAPTGPALGDPPDALESPWWTRAPERRIGQYWIKTDLPADRANALAAHLNRMYDAYAQRLAALPPRTPQRLNVLLFARRSEYDEVLRTRFGVDARNTGGIFFVNDLGSALAAWTEDLPRRRVEHVLQHEGFHQFAWSRFGGDLPVWANEGLAEFFGEAAMVGRELVIGQATPRVIDTVRDAIELESYIPFRTMLSMTSEQWRASLEKPTGPVQYPQAWSMVHFLVYGDGGRYVEAFEGYLRLLNQGVRSEEAFARMFGPDISAFEARWKVYAAAAEPSAFMTALERIEFLAEGALALARADRVPGSLDELRTALRGIDYVLDRPEHAGGAAIRAADDASFTIPGDEHAEETPVFVVEAPRTDRRGRHLADAPPEPPSIRTEHLRPRGLRIRWMRDRTTGALSYEIEAR